MSLFTQFTASAVKSVQSGVTVAAGTVVISSVNTSKSFVISVSKGSAGFVAARGTVTLSPSGGATTANGGSSQNQDGSFPTYSGPITGGTTDLTTAQYSARLTSSTQLTVDGPVEWQVIEFN